jgi:hypothetical protein
MEKKNAPAAIGPEPVAFEPIASDPVAVEPVASEAIAAEPIASEAIATELVTSEAVAAEPVAFEAIATEPIASEPVASEPITAEPIASESGASKRGASVNWASLMADGPLHKIGDCLLANEEYVDTYSALRQVCRNWRSDLPEPDMHLHEWIMVEHALPCAAEFTFLYLRTSRYITIDLTKVHARFKFLHIYRVNLFLFSIVNILVLNVIFINIF